MIDLQFKELAKQFIRVIRRARISRHAAALSFSSLLAIAPMMAIALAMLSLFGSLEGIGNNLQDFIFRFLVPAAGDEIRTYIDQFASQAGQLTLIGLGFFLLTALLLLFSIEESMNDIFALHRGRNITTRLTTYWAMMSLGPILMGASLSISTFLFSLEFFDSELTNEFRSLGISVLPILFELLAFLLLYLVMPNTKIALKHAVLGALVATVLFEVSKSAFAAYLGNFNNYQVIYGALSTLPIFLIWIYLSWLVTLCGAAVVATLQTQSNKALTEQEMHQ